MFPKEFDYYAPSTVRETLSLLNKHSENAKILAGGQSLVPLMKFRLVESETIVDINGVKELSFIRKNRDGALRIGALARHATIESSALIQTESPLLAQAASVIGDPHIRNRGTIGGSVAHMDPAGDYLPVLAALDSQISLASVSGTRTIDWEDFLLGMYTTSLQPSELLTQIRIPRKKLRQRGVYLKCAKSSGDFSIAGVASLIEIDKSGRCADCSIGIGGVEDRPVRARKAEKELMGSRITRDTLQKAAEIAAQEVRGSTDIHATAEYRRSLVQVLTRRSLERATGLGPA